MPNQSYSHFEIFTKHTQPTRDMKHTLIGLKLHVVLCSSIRLLKGHQIAGL